MIKIAEYDLGKVKGDDGADGQDGADGNGIASIELLSTSGKTKTYRITYTDGDHFDFNVTDGDDASVDIVTSWSGTLSDSKVPSEKLVKNSIPTKLSDLSNDSQFIEKSNTAGLVKNDGTIDTTTYISSLPSASTSTAGIVQLADNLTTNDDTKALTAKQGKALKDLIGDAISYINQ